MRLWLLVGLLLLTLSAGDSGEQYEFVAEVGRLMDILINSLYTQKEIFLRECISNASDALDKIRFEAIKDPSVLGTETELEIKIEFDKDAKTISIQDNGIGMTKQDLIQNLGTVAKSGTTNFLEAIKTGSLNLIGQFGVGFYSTFLAGSKVQVYSKNNADTLHLWESSATNSFTVSEDDSVDLKRGTIVKITLKEEAYEFCDYETLEKLIKRYSGFINFPIYLKNIVDVEEKQEKTQAELDKEKEEAIQKKKDNGEEVDEEAIENAINRTKIIKKPTEKWERMNTNKALWLRDPKEVEAKEYKDFFKAVFKDDNDPSVWEHFRAEGGDVEFSALLFVPERAPFDMMQKFYEKKAQVKLYVRRVLISEEFEDLLPKYLNFLRGVVDSDQLPLNVNRETLQQDKMLKTIGNKLLKKAIDMLVSFNPEAEEEEEELFDSEDEEEEEDGMSKKEKRIDKFNKFWKNYGKNIKLGLIEDGANKDKLAPLTRWYTTHNVSQLTSFDEIVGRMKSGQRHLYFLGGDNRETLQFSPLIEKLVASGYEVILGDDPLDENVFSNFKQYKDFRIINVARNDFKDPTKSDDTRKEIKSLTKTFQPLIDYMGQELKDVIKDVKISTRLVNHPAVIIADMMNDTPNRERIELGSAMKSSINFHQERNILEINPHHPLIQELNRRVQEQTDEDSARLVKTIYHAALIHTGFVVKDPLDFSKNVFGLINTALGVRGEELEEIEVTQEQIDEMEPKQPEPTPETPSEPSEPAASEAAPEHEVVELDDSQVTVEKVEVDTPAQPTVTETQL